MNRLNGNTDAIMLCVNFAYIALGWPSTSLKKKVPAVGVKMPRRAILNLARWWQLFTINLSAIATLE